MILSGIGRTALRAGAFAVLFAAGCRSYEGPFVHKSEDDLDAMEVVDEQVGQAFGRGAYEEADATLGTLLAEPTVSLPQYELERVSILLMQGRSDEAHSLMLKVRKELETLFDPELEEKAVSIWHGENNKVFKGDAHERATLYALLAISFLERGAWDDAERCVKNGILADSTNTREAQYNSDYGLLFYLGAVACGKAGRAADAAAYLGQMKTALEGRGVSTGAGSSASELLVPMPLPDAFVIAWMGNAPQYVRGGEYGEIRHPVRGTGMSYAFLTFETDGSAAPELVAPSRLADINWQALTRGGREMDTVLAQKASVKSGMRTSRNVFLVAGYSCIGTVSSNPIAEAFLLGSGGTCLAIGGLFHLAGSAMNARSDVRCWHCLPGEMVVMPLRMTGATAEVTVRGYNHLLDNVAIATSTLRRNGDGMAVRHLHIWPSKRAASTLSAWDSAAMNSAASAAKSSDMAYEIKFVKEDRQ